MYTLGQVENQQSLAELLAEAFFSAEADGITWGEIIGRDMTTDMVTIANTQLNNYIIPKNLFNVANIPVAARMLKVAMFKKVYTSNWWSFAEGTQYFYDFAANSGSPTVMTLLMVSESNLANALSGYFSQQPTESITKGVISPLTISRTTSPIVVPTVPIVTVPEEEVIGEKPLPEEEFITEAISMPESQVEQDPEDIGSIISPTATKLPVTVPEIPVAPDPEDTGSLVITPSGAVSDIIAGADFSQSRFEFEPVEGEVEAPPEEVTVVPAVEVKKSSMGPVLLALGAGYLLMKFLKK